MIINNVTQTLLVLAPDDSTIGTILSVFTKHGFQTQRTPSMDEAIQLLEIKNIHAVISSFSSMQTIAYSFYKRVKQQILAEGIPFFVYMEQFDKSDLIIGLELGIDNFFFPNDDEISVMNKLTIESLKRKNINIFTSEQFLEYFNASSVAMFYLNHDQIVKVNGSFLRLMGISDAEVIGMRVTDVFHFLDSDENALVYRRFFNGIIPICKLENVACCKEKDTRFHLRFFRGFIQGIKHVFAEVVFADAAGIAHKSASHNANYFSAGFEIEKTNALSYHLTQREKQILHLSAQGHPIKIIAGELNLSERTVEKHRSNIMTKTDSKNMIEAIAACNDIM